MKLAIRIFVLSVVVAGAAAAATTPKTAPAIPEPPVGHGNMPGRRYADPHMRCSVQHVRSSSK